MNDIYIKHPYHVQDKQRILLGTNLTEFPILTFTVKLGYPISLTRKEENVLLNDMLNTFYLRLYGFKRVLKDHSDTKKGNPMSPLHVLFLLAARDLLYVPFQRQNSTYQGLCYFSHGTLAGTRNSSMGPPWWIDPMTHHSMCGCSSMGLHFASDYLYIF